MWRGLKWDLKFLELAKHVSGWSKDPSTKCGAVIVRPDNTICSIGYNGFPKNMTDRKEWYDNREEKYSRIVHAEINSLIHAREPVKGYKLYTYPFCCCDRCSVQMMQAGISRFVFPQCPSHLMERWGKVFETTKKYFWEAGLPFTEVDMETQQCVSNPR